MNESSAQFHLCHCADLGVEPHLPALFWSIARSHPDQKPLIHFVCLGGDTAFPARVKTEAARHGLSCETYWLRDLPESRFRGLRTYRGGCRGNPGCFYGRWLLAELLPTSVDRVVYLDVDVLVQRDLRLLISLLPEGGVVAAASDMPFDSCPAAVYRDYYLPHLLAAGISTRRGDMYNSGVLVLSLERWRDEGIVDHLTRTRNSLLAKGVSLRFQDQDVFNVALANRIHPIPSDWNVTPLYLPAGYWASEDLSLVNILHFVTSPKPWRSGQWMKLPAQAVKAYANARACSEARAEDSQLWRDRFELYQKLTDNCTLPLTPKRMRLLRQGGDVPISASA